MFPFGNAAKKAACLSKGIVRRADAALGAERTMAGEEFRDLRKLPLNELRTPDAAAAWAEARNIPYERKLDYMSAGPAYRFFETVRLGVGLDNARFSPGGRKSLEPVHEVKLGYPAANPREVSYYGPEIVLKSVSARAVDGKRETTARLEGASLRDAMDQAERAARLYDSHDL